MKGVVKRDLKLMDLKKKDTSKGFGKPLNTHVYLFLPGLTQLYPGLRRFTRAKLGKNGEAKVDKMDPR